MALSDDDGENVARLSGEDVLRDLAYILGDGGVSGRITYGVSYERDGLRIVATDASGATRTFAIDEIDVHEVEPSGA